MTSTLKVDLLKAKTTDGDVTIGDDLHLDSDSAVLKFGDDAEITLTHVHNAGLTLSGNLYLPDNKYLNIGTSNDLTLYHDGSDSHIKDQGTGDLYISAGDDLVLRSKQGAETALVANDDGSVELYHDNVKKLETQSGGVEITGALDADNFKINGAQGSDGQVLTSTGSGVAWEAAGGGGATYDIIYSGTNPSTSTYIDCDGYNYIKCVGLRDATGSGQNQAVGIFTTTFGNTATFTNGYYVRLNSSGAYSFGAYNPDTGAGYIGSNNNTDDWTFCTEIWNLGGPTVVVHNYSWMQSSSTMIGHYFGSVSSTALRYLKPIQSHSVLHVIGAK